MNMYSMPGYFQNMPTVGKELVNPNAENTDSLKAVENDIHASIEKVLAAGITSEEKLNERGQLSAMQRINALIDAGTWCPLNSLFNPENNKFGTTNIVNGLGRIGGKWAVIVASDNKKMAGAWVPGQAENLLRCSDTAKMMHLPLVYLLNCSGVEFPNQDKVYPNRRGGGTPFFRNSELNQLGIPVIVGIYGTNPAGGGYHSISPTILIAHQDANMAVGGAGILSGMNPKGYIDEEAAEQIVAAQIENSKQHVPAPGSVPIHYDETGFFREVYQNDVGVIEGIKKYISYLPAYNLEFFRVDAPKAPLLPAEDLYSIIPMNQKRPYDVYDVIGRLFDGSELAEYKKGYGPEMVTGLAKVNGLLVGVIANVQGLLMNYPEYKQNSVGIGGKSLIYSIENSKLPSLQVTLRKASAAAHYVLGGPQGNNTNVFSIGTGACEYYVMPGETAANAMYSRKLVKAKKAGEDMTPIIGKMNEMIQMYTDKSRPKYCTEKGMVDEIVDVTDLRPYIQAFTEAVYQNPQSICPMHQMIAPRSIREFQTFGK